MYAISVSHKTAPVDIRKLFAFTTDEQILFIKSAVACEHITQCVILNTCNRLEIYYEGDNLATKEIENLLTKFKNILAICFLSFII